jgi:hypothetical protein
MVVRDTIYGLSGITDDEKQALLQIIYYSRPSRYFKHTYEFAHNPVDLKNWLGVPMTRLKTTLRRLADGGWIQWYPSTGQINVMTEKLPGVMEDTDMVGGGQEWL